MIVHYDLHVHSVLSTCADVLMTPNNILNMATLKGIDVLAVTDHNSLKQLPMLRRIADSYRLLFVPGVEVTLADASHILVYFRHDDEALAFDRRLEALIDRTPCGPATPRPLLTDEEDQPATTLPYRLDGALPLDLPGLCRLLAGFDHLRFLAHADRPMNSGIRHWGEAPMDGIELTPGAAPDFLQRHWLEGIRVLHDSDAHDLVAIAEPGPQNALVVPELTIDALFRELRHD